ncbi:MAG: hypothetical protein ACRDVP_11480 [Acidimicrobiales bacterium]
MFEATVEGLVGRGSPRLREVLRSRELLLGLFYNGRFEAESEQLEAYFMQFALAARNQAGQGQNPGEQRSRSRFDRPRTRGRSAGGRGLASDEI